MSNSVNHPQHYGGEDNKYEAIKIIEAWNCGFCLGTALKYLVRAGKKDQSKLIEDYKKALWYVQRAFTNQECVDVPKEGDYCLNSVLKGLIVCDDVKEVLKCVANNQLEPGIWALQYMTDHTLIGKALKIAEMWNLQDDFLESYNNYIWEGRLEDEAINMALYDWDLPLITQ